MEDSQQAGKLAYDEEFEIELKKNVQPDVGKDPADMQNPMVTIITAKDDSRDSMEDPKTHTYDGTKVSACTMYKINEAKSNDDNDNEKGANESRISKAFPERDLSPSPNPAPNSQSATNKVQNTPATLTQQNKTPPKLNMLHTNVNPTVEHDFFDDTPVHGDDHLQTHKAENKHPNFKNTPISLSAIISIKLNLSPFDFTNISPTFTQPKKKRTPLMSHQSIVMKNLNPTMSKTAPRSLYHTKREQPWSRLMTMARQGI